MRLSDRDIEYFIKKKKLIIIPTPCKKFINGVTVDIRLGNQFYTFCKKKRNMLISVNQRVKFLLF